MASTIAEAGWDKRAAYEPGQIEYRKHVCIAFPEEAGYQAIVEQQKADNGEEAWRFTDPERVAQESLKQHYPNETPALKRVRKLPARQVFRWKRGNTRVLVVVTRPYWLSFQAKSTPVVWVSTTIQEAGCK